MNDIEPEIERVDIDDTSVDTIDPSDVEASSEEETISQDVIESEEVQPLDLDGQVLTDEVSDQETVDASAGELEEYSSEVIEEIEYLEDQQVLSIIESILFASSKPQGLSVFKQVFKGTDVDSAKIKKSIEALKIDYAGGSRGITIEETTGGFQLRTKSDNMVFLKRMIKGRSFKLSGPALEVLSIVAYKQPCIKSDVDEIRGVESGHILRGLMDRGLVSFAGKSELPGKPMLYVTSRKFLEIFGLRNLNELPSLSEIDELLPEGIEEQAEEKQTLDQLTDQLSKDAVETYSEGEEELGKITEKLSAISSSTEFFEMEKQRLKKEKEEMRAQDIEDALTVGEDVPAKDIKWLERYKENLQAQEQEQAEEHGQETDSVHVQAAEGAINTEDLVSDASSFDDPQDAEVDPQEVAASSEIDTQEFSVEEAAAEIDSQELSAEEVTATVDSQEPSVEVSAAQEATEANKIGDVDVSSLKDDLDFLDS